MPITKKVTQSAKHRFATIVREVGTSSGSELVPTSLCVGLCRDAVTVLDVPRSWRRLGPGCSPVSLMVYPGNADNPLVF